MITTCAPKRHPSNKGFTLFPELLGTLAFGALLFLAAAAATQNHILQKLGFLALGIVVLCLAYGLGVKIVRRIQRKVNQMRLQREF
jgi:4-hydroxybenzoate polyprenyltransferase